MPANENDWSNEITASAMSPSSSMIDVAGGGQAADDAKHDEHDDERPFEREDAVVFAPELVARALHLISGLLRQSSAVRHGPITSRRRQPAGLARLEGRSGRSR